MEYNFKKENNIKEYLCKVCNQEFGSLEGIAFHVCNEDAGDDECAVDRQYELGLG